MAARAVSLKVYYYFEALLWLLDVNKDGGWVMTFVRNLTCYGYLM
jgi:hypothetical protein